MAPTVNLESPLLDGRDLHNSQHHVQVPFSVHGRQQRLSGTVEISAVPESECPCTHLG